VCVNVAAALRLLAVIRIALRNVNFVCENSNEFVIHITSTYFLSSLFTPQIRDLEARVEILSGGQGEALAEIRSILRGASPPYVGNTRALSFK
jgi:hypothetical protein